MSNPRFQRAVALALALVPALSVATGTTVEDRLRALEERQAQLERQLAERDAKIRQLETKLGGQAATQTAGASPVSSTASSPGPLAPTVAATPVGAPDAAPAAGAPGTTPDDAHYWGRYEGGRGIVLARSDNAEVDFSAFAYIRYLNQLALDETYTDAFGRTKTLDLRNDLQFQKVTLNFKGWLFDPDFRYLFYTWTSNTSQGQDAQVVVAGNLSYHFDDAFSLAGGIGALPSTQSTNYTFPNWLRVDHRTIADEFFRGSYTSGIWAWGQIAPALRYRVMVGNNLSQLGIDAGELDATLNTISGALWWMPTTGEYGPAEGLGDFEHHVEAATLFSLHYTRSREDAQSQPGVNDFENSQIRLSDGTLLFQADPFGTGTQVDKATYQMIAASAGVKYRGWSLDGEYYWRRVDDFRANGPMPFAQMNDHGFQLQGSTMVLPQALQAYVSGSKIYGEYGDPWDVALGINWFPLQRKELRVNVQGLYLEDSPVGYASVPFAVGGNGWVLSTDVMLNF
ncbi:MAG TPA: hypothetical protein VF851_03045 [Steroidobacteraceae bacterium]